MKSVILRTVMLTTVAACLLVSLAAGEDGKRPEARNGVASVEELLSGLVDKAPKAAGGSKASDSTSAESAEAKTPRTSAVPGEAEEEAGGESDAERLARLVDLRSKRLSDLKEKLAKAEKDLAETREVYALKAKRISEIEADEPRQLALISLESECRAVEKSMLVNIATLKHQIAEEETRKTEAEKRRRILDLSGATFDTGSRGAGPSYSEVVKQAADRAAAYFDKIKARVSGEGKTPTEAKQADGPGRE